MTDTPFKGLNPYSEADAKIFFGRKDLRESIIDNLKVRRLTLFHGASGVGKSSVLRAGVAYALRQETKKNLEKYQTPRSVVVVFPPDPPAEAAANSSDMSYAFWRDDPLTALKQQIEADIQKSIATLQSPQADLSLVETLKAWTEGFNDQAGCGELFIILDQFEEFFVYHPQQIKESNSQEVEESNFVIEFAQAVNHADLHVNFLISIRSDSLFRLDRFQEYSDPK
ncbi:MAG: ATP-binding protein [Coleofasciculus sp. S288]|nr:ATP-binding protein [Coleofasciculus sp. S288]